MESVVIVLTGLLPSVRGGGGGFPASFFYRVFFSFFLEPFAMKTHCIVTLKLSYVTAHFPATAPSSLTVSIIANRKKRIKRERKGKKKNFRENKKTRLGPVFLRATVTPHHVTSLITIFKNVNIIFFIKKSTSMPPKKPF